MSDFYPDDVATMMREKARQEDQRLRDNAGSMFWILKDLQKAGALTPDALERIDRLTARVEGRAA